MKPGIKKFSGEILCVALMPEQPARELAASKPRIVTAEKLRIRRIGGL